MKRFLAISLAIVMLLALAACGAKQETPSASAEGEAAAPAEGKFILGVNVPLSGAQSDAGQQNLNAVQLAVKQFNAEGGFNGQQIELVIYDDEADPATSLANTVKLCTEDNVNAIIGSQMSSCMVGVLDTLTQYQIPCFTGGTSPSLTSQGCKYVFRSTINQDYVMVDVMKCLQSIGIKTAGIFTGEDEAQIASGDAFVESCKEIGIEIVGWEYGSDTDTDYTAQCARLIAANPDTIFYAGSAEAQTLIPKQLRQNGYNKMLWHKESVAQYTVDIIGEAADYIGFSWPMVQYTSVEDADVKVKDFLAAYEAEYGVLPTSNVAYRGYDAMLILKAGVEAAGTNEPAAIAAAIHTLDNIPACGGIMDFTNGTGEGYQSGQLFYVKGGKFVSFTDWYESGGYDEWASSVS